MTGYLPPRPVPFATRPPLPDLLRRLRRNLLEVWHERHFEEPCFPTRLLARRILVCNSPETVRAAFIGQHEALSRKTPEMRHALAPLVGDGLIVSDGAVWRDRRRAVAPVTHASRIGALAPAMTGAVMDRAALWAARPAGVPVDMLAEMGALAAETICRALFGRALGAAAAGQVVEAFGRYQRGSGLGDLAALLGAPWLAPRLRAVWLRPQAARIRAVLDRLVAEALAPAGDPCLIRSLAADAGLSPAALRNEAATLFLAGHETTATTLAWAWFLLSQAPEAASRLAAEADAALAGRAAGHADLPALPFTRAVVEETLRLYPPIPLLARQADRAIEIGGHRVRRGDVVMAVPWLLHRHRALWPQPDHFLPERFLAGPPPRHGYIPFGLGPRVCTGAQFALAEAVICLATLAQRFAPRLAPGAVVFPVCRLTLRPGETLPMLLDYRA